MQDLLNEVKKSVFSEYKRANKKYSPAFNSNHEAYAVITEEYEESKDCEEVFTWFDSQYWQDIKEDNFQGMFDNVQMMQEYAELAAAEWIQVAAMCFKARKGDMFEQSKP